MKYIFLISSLFQFLDFAVLANNALENYYKSMMILSVYHEKFTSHLRDEYLRLSLGPRSVDYSITTLLLEEEEENVPDLVMRKEDIRWNHLYLSATQNHNDLSKHCSTMAAYLTMFQLILTQDRLYEFGNIIDDYNRENTFSLMPSFFKPVKDSASGRDALATAQNMELLSKVTEVLNEVVERRTVRRQYPVTPLDPWIFPANEERAPTRRSAAEAVVDELAFDFYLREAPATEEAGAAAAERLGRLELEEPRSADSEGEDVEASERSSAEPRPADSPTVVTTEPEPEAEAEASSSRVPRERTAPVDKEPSEEEKEREWRNYSDNLKTIDEKYNNIVDDDYDVFYYKCLWKELLAIYGDAFVQVLEYFHFAISGSSYKSSVESWTDSFEDYVPNMDESLAVWEKAEELYGSAKADYQSEKSGREKEFSSHPVAVLQTIATIRHARRNQGAAAAVDENRLRGEWTLQYVNPANGSADLKVV